LTWESGLSALLKPPVPRTVDDRQAAAGVGIRLGSHLGANDARGDKPGTLRKHPPEPYTAPIAVRRWGGGSIQQSLSAAGGALDFRQLGLAADKRYSLFPMSALKLRLLRWLLSRALSCNCPDRIPRSGEAGAQVNCFSVYLDKAGEPYLLMRRLSGQVASCSEWTGNVFEKPAEIALTEIPTKDLSVTHFYGHSEVTYSGLLDFAIGRIFFLPYIRIGFARIIGTVDQYFFNKKKLVTKQRMDLLRVLVARELEGRSIGSPIDLMTELYTLRWVMHPQRDPQQHRLTFYLDSMVDTGELKKVNGDYKLTGEALKAIEIYEEQERKHTENVKVQRRMAWLTFAIVLLTAAQAGLFKLPLLIDWSK
jgi:hypothetical protein